MEYEKFEKETKVEKKEPKKEDKKVVIDENFAFGLKVKPSTPIGKILGKIEDFIKFIKKMSFFFYFFE